MIQEPFCLAHLEIELPDEYLHVGAKRSGIYHHLSHATSHECCYNILIAECVARRGGVPQ